MELLFTLLRDIGLSFVVAVCWGILFGSPKKVLLAAGLLGGFGHGLRFILLLLDIGLISSTLIASVLIGLCGIYVAHTIHHPPVVFTMPACITMIPGLYAYRTMLSGIKFTEAGIINEDPYLLTEMMHNLMVTVSLLFTLAIGISVGVLLFRKRSTREISFIRKRSKSNNPKSK
ncbi:MAG: threonine/serine exporter family protein [Candidatus Azobacteroides sp.]|nr:threonine/serine exporter family protein [Candidatus Azobacteroides sp.]